MVAAAIPEILEVEVGESIGSRTGSLPSFKELGPVDLVHISKSIPKSKDVGTYHYVTGVDASSSASIAAYVNTLTFSLGETQTWFGKQPGWKVNSGVYCVYNAFSRIDVRVTAQIPGSVQTSFIDERGDRQDDDLTDQQWDETFMSGMLRSLLYCDDEQYYVACCRRLNPLSKEASVAFLQAFERLYSLGPQLGSFTETQVPTLTENYLVDGFYKFVELTGLFDQAVEVLDRLEENEPAVVVLRAKVLLLQNREVDSIKVMNHGIQENPRDPDLLQLQANFCKDKKRLDLALDCAIRAVNSAPSEFWPWHTMVQVYTARGEYDLALLSLNSCPMFTFHDLDIHRMPPASRVHLPMPSDGELDEVWTADPTISQEGADPELLKLPAPILRATFAKAYDLLTEIVSHIGWDALLKTRSNVFVMEEEYRKEKRKGSTADGTNGNGNGHSTSSDNVSTAAIVDKPPSTAAAPADEGAAASSVTASQPPIAGEIKNKRLCERWLDNLFMVLYDDLRVYTVWRSNYVQAQSQQGEYHKTALEWEILGMVAARLKHKDEALEAFAQSLNQKFNHRALWKLLEFQSNKQNYDLDLVVRLVAWNHRWYSDFSPKLTTMLRAIVAKEGLTKVENSVAARYHGQGILQLMDDRYKFLKQYNAAGIDG